MSNLMRRQGLPACVVHVAAARYFVYLLQRMGHSPLLQSHDNTQGVGFGDPFGGSFFAAVVVCTRLCLGMAKEAGREARDRKGSEREFTQDPLCQVRGKVLVAKDIIADQHSDLDESELDAEDGRLSPHPWMS